MNRGLPRGLRDARSVWSASGSPALWHVRKSGSKLAALQTLARQIHFLSGSWPQLASIFWRCSLSMNRPWLGVPPLGDLALHRLKPELQTRPGSWLRFASKFCRFFLSMNRYLQRRPRQGAKRLECVRLAGALARPKKREQARRTPNAGAPIHVLPGSWLRCAILKSWRPSSSRRRRF